MWVLLAGFNLITWLVLTALLLYVLFAFVLPWALKKIKALATQVTGQVQQANASGKDPLAALVNGMISDLQKLSDEIKQKVAPPSAISPPTDLATFAVNAFQALRAGVVSQLSNLPSDATMAVKLQGIVAAIDTAIESIVPGLATLMPLALSQPGAQATPPTAPPAVKPAV
jgi:hypothetical protein